MFGLWLLLLCAGAPAIGWAQAVAPPPIADPAASPVPVPAITPPPQPVVPVAPPPPAVAASPAAAAELERLLATLENETDRQRLIETLRGLLAAQRGPQAQPAPEEAPTERVAGRFVETLAQEIGGVGAAVLRAATFAADLPKLWRELAAVFANPLMRARMVETATTLVIILACAWVAEWLTNFALRRPRQRFEARTVGDGWRRLLDGVQHAMLAAVPIIAFGAVAFLVLGLLEPSFVVALVAVAMINACLIARVIGLLSWMVLAPRAPRLRMLPLNDETATYVHIWTRRIAATSIYGQFVAEAAYIVGLPYTGYVLLLKLLALVVAMMLTVVILQNRAIIAAFIVRRTSRKRGELSGEAPAERTFIQRFADLWHVPALVFIGAVLIAWLVRQDNFGVVLRAAVLTIVLVGSPGTELEFAL